MLPGVVAGAQETELTPRPCAGKMTLEKLLSLNSRTETEPSEEAQAKRQPDSWGDHDTMLTEALWRAKSKMRCHWFDCSRQMNTLPS